MRKLAPILFFGSLILIAACLALWLTPPEPAAPIAPRIESPTALKLPGVFSDHMVLQRDRHVRVWGWAPPGQPIELQFASQSHNTEADAQGNWSVTLDPMPAGGPHELAVSTPTETQSVIDILMGDVWFCSGQSNMEMTVAPDYYSGIIGYEQLLKDANKPNIRLLKVRNRTSSTPQKNLEASWQPATPDSVATFSAVGYCFGKQLHEELDVPIGLIASSWGGTPSEAWTSRTALESLPIASNILSTWDQAAQNYQPTEENSGQRAPADNQRRPANLFNAMVHPLIPYTIRGAIWYQGEQNATRAEQYRSLFPLLIHDWRGRWGQGDFPFYFVQLANYQPAPDKPGPSTWAELREAQSMTLSLPNTAMAVTIDIGEADDIHPRNKQEVARRLALCALAKEYGQTDLAYAGPQFQHMTIEADQIRLHFTHTHGGLAAKDGPLTRFQIAGSDKQFVWADAVIDGSTVVVSSKDVPSPVAVRYAWADNPQGCNLYNGQNLPASPFRTDRWPGITANKTTPQVN